MLLMIVVDDVNVAICGKYIPGTGTAIVTNMKERSNHFYFYTIAVPVIPG